MGSSSSCAALIHSIEGSGAGGPGRRAMSIWRASAAVKTRSAIPIRAALRWTPWSSVTRKSTAPAFTATRSWLSTQSLDPAAGEPSSASTSGRARTAPRRGYLLKSTSRARLRSTSRSRARSASWASCLTTLWPAVRAIPMKSEATRAVGSSSV